MTHHPILFVSLGPGDPELITLKGLKALQGADLVFCPSTTLPGGRILSRAGDILLQLGVESSKVVSFDVPMNKDRSLAIACYTNIAATIATLHQKGQRVAVTAEGDAGFYSTIFYISEYLQAHHIPTSRIAGVPAFIACGTWANIHIVKQEEELTVIPGMISAEELIHKLKGGQTLVVMKASQCQSAIKEAMPLLADACFHYFENVGIADKEYYTSDTTAIADRPFPYFSLLIIQSNA